MGLVKLIGIASRSVQQGVASCAFMMLGLTTIFTNDSN